MELQERQRVLDHETTVKLNPTRSVYSVIGALCLKTDLLRNPEYIIEPKDFVTPVTAIIFKAIHNIAWTNTEVVSLTSIDIDNYLAQYPEQYAIWEQQKGMDYINDTINNTNPNTFGFNYNLLKKYSLLRHYLSYGIDISEIYDINNNDFVVEAQQKEKFEELSIDDIVEFFTIKMINVRESFSRPTESKGFEAGDEIETLMQRIKDGKSMGFPYVNTAYNTIFRGKKKGKLLIRSADSGAGKTRNMIADCVFGSCDEYYDIWRDIWVDNTKFKIPTLYISTEIDKEEVQLIILATISGVNADVIEDGNYGKSIEERLNKSMEIMKNMTLYVEYIKDFSISDISMMIEKYIVSHGTEVVGFDYIQITPKLARSIVMSYGMNMREDQIMARFSDALKNIAETKNIFVGTSTQLNRSSSEYEKRDDQSLSGGSAVINKADMGVLLFRVGDRELSKLRPIIEQKGFDEPNYSHWIYKNRGGKFNRVILWTYMDLGNMREKPLFVTDYDFKEVECKFTKVEPNAPSGFGNSTISNQISNKQTTKKEQSNVQNQMDIDDLPPDF